VSELNPISEEALRKIQTEFDFTKELQDHPDLVGVMKDGKIGIFSRSKGELVVPLEYDDVEFLMYDFIVLKKSSKILFYDVKKDIVATGENIISSL